MDRGIYVIKAEYVKDLTLDVFFSDAAVRRIDFGKFIRSNPHPQHSKYLDKSNFMTFSIENGNLVWGDDWDMIFPVEDLYDCNL